MKEISVKFGIVFLIVIIFLSMGQSQGNKEDDEVIKEVKKEENVKVAVTVNDDVNYVDLDEYLLGVVAGEMPANFEKEALKAQVVASRTYVYNRNLSVDNTTNTQVYLDDSEMKKKWEMCIRDSIFYTSNKRNNWIFNKYPATNLIIDYFFSNIIRSKFII